MKRFPKSDIFSFKGEEGASAVEYAVLLALIATVIIFSVGFLGVSTRDGLDSVNPAWPDASRDETIDDPDNGCGNEDSPDDNDCGHGNDLR
jgi:Flp pilus assembly pilin Flp